MESLGEERKVTPTYHVKVDRLDSMEKPYCVFYIRYRPQGRSLDILSSLSYLIMRSIRGASSPGNCPNCGRSPVQQNTQGTGGRSGSRKSARAGPGIHSRRLLLLSELTAPTQKTRVRRSRSRKNQSGRMARMQMLRRFVAIRFKANSTFSF